METTKSLILILVGAVILLNLQLIYLFPRSKNDDVSDGYSPCEREVIINFNFPHWTNSERSKTADLNKLLEKWNKTKASEGKVLALRRRSQNFLTIGIPTRKWSNGPASLTQTLSSVINATKLQEKLEIVVVVILLDNDRAYNYHLLSTIVQKFSFYIDIGFIHIVEPVENKAGQETSVITQDINNQALKFMSNYTLGLSSYYMHLEDDVESAPGFYFQIRNFIKMSGLDGSISWNLLEFSEMGLVGKFLKSKDLYKFATFMSMFSSKSEPIERTLMLFRYTTLQQKAVMLKPTLFQRLDESNQAVIHKDSKRVLKDRFFVGVKKSYQGDDPEGQVVTNMEPVSDSLPEYVYRGGQNGFWARNPKAGDWITIVFETEVELDKVIVATGFHDDQTADKKGLYALHNATVEASPKLLRMDIANKRVTCASYKRIGVVTGGFAEITDISGKVYNRNTKCLTLRILADEPENVLFQQISVFQSR